MGYLAQRLLIAQILSSIPKNKGVHYSSRKTVLIQLLFQEFLPKIQSESPCFQPIYSCSSPALIFTTYYVFPLACNNLLSFLSTIICFTCTAPQRAFIIPVALLSTCSGFSMSSEIMVPRTGHNAPSIVESIQRKYHYL